jgi:hypothetical protein
VELEEVETHLRVLALGRQRVPCAGVNNKRGLDRISCIPSPWLRAIVRAPIDERGALCEIWQGRGGGCKIAEDWGKRKGRVGTRSDVQEVADGTRYAVRGGQNRQLR